MRRVMLAVVALAGGCGPVEVRFDETRGIPSVTGSTEVDLASFTCGQPITSGEYTVATKVVTDGCELSFDKDVEVVKASDYQSIPDLRGASNLVQRVELKIRKLSFVDAATGQELDPNTRLASASLLMNGQQVADKSVLSALPKTVQLSGDALNQVKAKVDARQPASVRARCVVVINTTPPPPAKLKIDYDAQPAIIIGPGKLF